MKGHIPLHYFSEERKIILEKIPAGYRVYFESPFGKYFCGYLLRTIHGTYIFKKVVDLKEHKGRYGQYYVFYHTVGTAKEVIDYLEQRFGLGKLEAYAVEFVEGERTLGIVRYDWLYFLKHRKVKAEEGYEPQYQIDLPENINELLDIARKTGKRFFVEYSYEKEEAEIRWF